MPTVFWSGKNAVTVSGSPEIKHEGYPGYAILLTRTVYTAGVHHMISRGMNACLHVEPELERNANLCAVLDSQTSPRQWHIREKRDRLVWAARSAGSKKLALKVEYKLETEASRVIAN